jgi:hypothetical protein
MAVKNAENHYEAHARSTSIVGGFMAKARERSRRTLLRPINVQQIHSAEAGLLDLIGTSIRENAQSGYITKGGLTSDTAREGHAF